VKDDGLDRLDLRERRLKMTSITPNLVLMPRYSRYRPNKTKPDLEDMVAEIAARRTMPSEEQGMNRQYIHEEKEYMMGRWAVHSSHTHTSPTSCSAMCSIDRGHAMHGGPSKMTQLVAQSGHWLHLRGANVALLVALPASRSCHNLKPVCQSRPNDGMVDIKTGINEERSTNRSLQLI
jgi:hypothetical protein